MEEFLTLIQVVFWSVGVVFILFDFLLPAKKRHILGSLISTLESVSRRLRDTPIKEWKIKVAFWWHSFFYKSSESTSSSMAFMTDSEYWTDRKKWNKKTKNFRTRVARGDKAARKAFFNKLLVSILFINIPLVCLILFFVTGKWVFGVLSIPAVIITLIRPLKAYFTLNSDISYSRIKENTVQYYYFSAFSSYVTLLAFLISIYWIPVDQLNSYWFELQQGKALPEKSMVLSIVNFIFDFFTILFSLYLMNFVIKKRKFFFPIALADILLSFGLAIAQYLLLMVITDGNFEHLNIHFESFINFMESFFWTNPEQAHGVDIHLVPIVFTSFAPVSIYMGIFIILSFSRVFLKGLNFFLQAMIEKEDKLIAKLGTLCMALGTSITLVKMLVKDIG
ncbi:MAG: hypothetical protein GYB31_08315 [Bacteroidetes bacterium]|nr:hypothetical protein [Bacteroidota bacterium]